jgi:hypothetical protein
MKNLNPSLVRTCYMILFLALNGCVTTSLVNQRMQYSNPPWAPAYNPGVRYYYIPDIETYYDLSDQGFVFLDNGQWLFSNTLPPIYSGYDLYNGYVIALNQSVYQPWMHHQFYVSNYPRFYYRSLYSNTEIQNIRGFNENERKPVYWKQEDRERMNELRQRNSSESKHEISRPPQNSNYYGKRIGQPVKVQPHMRENKQGNQGQRRHN